MSDWAKKTNSHDRSNWQEIALNDPTLKDRFLNKINKDFSGCWLWTASTMGNNNYGAIKVGGKYGLTLEAHRISWFLYNGNIPLNKCVLHHCDTPKCVNPDHLWLGTHQENMTDMVIKGRCISGVAQKLTCKRGHPLNGRQKYSGKSKYSGNIYRFCLECRSQRKYKNGKLGKENEL